VEVEIAERGNGEKQKEPTVRMERSVKEVPCHAQGMSKRENLTGT